MTFFALVKHVFGRMHKGTHGLGIKIDLVVIMQNLPLKKVGQEFMQERSGNHSLHLDTLAHMSHNHRSGMDKRIDVASNATNMNK